MRLYATRQVELTQAVNHRKKSIEKYTDEYRYMVSVHTSST